MRWQGTVLAYVLALALLTGGCGGSTNTISLGGGASTSSSGSSSSGSGSTASPAGIWTGSDSATGLSLTALINSSNQADVIRADGVQFIGTAQASGSDLAIAVDGYTEFGGGFTDGSTKGVGTFSGSFTAEGSISGTLNFTTSANAQSSSTWSLGFDSLYDTASALSAIAGAYTESLPSGTSGTDPMQGASVTITGLGGISAQGATSGCVLSGSVTVTDAKSDIYGITFKLSECTGDYAVLNAVPFAGLADLDPTSPAHMLIGASGQLSGTSYAMVLSLTAT